jgi:hypothetical protein
MCDDLLQNGTSRSGNSASRRDRWDDLRQVRGGQSPKRRRSIIVRQPETGEPSGLIPSVSDTPKGPLRNFYV